MSIIKVLTFTNVWLIWHKVVIEIDSNKSLPWIEIVWLWDTSIKESKERIKSTLRNSWINIPPIRIILNLSPSSLKKIWTRYDLPMAMAILLMIFPDKIFHQELILNSIFIWELWLDWSVKKIEWILTSVISAKLEWYNTFFVPYENMEELSFIEWISIFPINYFSQIIDYFINWVDLFNFKWSYNNLNLINWNDLNTFNLVKWTYFVKKSLIISAAWFHNMLMVWPPWTWKTLMSKTLSTLMPDLTFDEIIEVSQIYSILWILSKEFPLVTKRPFRNVHHTSSIVSIIWGWSNILPWEVSLSHKWILFLDELTEFPKNVLDSLRQPIEDKVVTISRANWKIDYPCDFLLLASMNPCKCWYFKDKEKDCICSINEVKSYQSKISWPILDRFDIILDVPRLNWDDLLSKETNINDNKLLDNIEIWIDMQNRRYINDSIKFNSQLTVWNINKYVILENDVENFFKNYIKSRCISNRSIFRILKLSRTISDLNGSDKINKSDILEAIQYRSCFYFI